MGTNFKGYIFRFYLSKQLRASAVDFEAALLAAGEGRKFLLVVEVVYFHLHAVEFVAVEGVYLAAHGFEERGHDVLGCRGDSPTYDDEAVDERCGRGHGVARHFAHFGERLAGRLGVALPLAFGNVEYVFRFQIVIGPAGQLPVNALYGADCNAVFRYDVRHFLVGQAEGLDAGVVAAVEPAVDERAYC